MPQIRANVKPCCVTVLIRWRLPRVIADFPPMRSSDELKKVTDGVLRINDAMIRQSQLPESVVTEAAISLKRPNYWT